MPRYKTSKNKSSEKYYNFTGEIYQEHFQTKELVRDFLRDNLHTSCAVSVVHDSDFFAEDDLERGIHAGDSKKPHFHFVLHYRGQQSLNTVRDKISAFGSCLQCDNIDFMCRYFSHIDQPFKAQYSKEVATYMFDFEKHYHALECDEDKLDTIAMLIVVNDLHTFQSLLKFCYDNSEFKYLTKFLMNKMYFVKEFVQMIVSKNYNDTERQFADSEEEKKLLKDKLKTQHKQLQHSCYLASTIINKVA